MKVMRHHRSGAAVLVVLALLGILSLYVLVNARTLTRLKHDVRQVELRQLQRLKSFAPPPGASAAITNSPASSSSVGTQVLSPPGVIPAK